MQKVQQIKDRQDTYGTLPLSPISDILPGDLTDPNKLPVLPALPAFPKLTDIQDLQDITDVKPDFNITNVPDIAPLAPVLPEFPPINPNIKPLPSPLSPPSPPSPLSPPSPPSRPSPPSPPSPSSPPGPVNRKKKTKKLPKKPCATGFYMDDQSGLCLEVMKTCPAVEGCKLELTSLGLKLKEAEKILDSVKEDLIICQSSSSGWKQIEDHLKSINLTKEEADRILVAIGKHLSARIRAGENLDSLLDKIQKTLDLSIALPVPEDPVLRPELFKKSGNANKPSAQDLLGVQLRKVTLGEKKSTQKDLESTLQSAIMQNPGFIARRQAIEGTQDENQWA
jgi:hypothetical protein